ncbi:MAG: helix-hairpin-helix domain-containing protein [Chitinophagales bacterium]
MLKWLGQYFTFSRGERNGIIVLLLGSLVVLAGSRVYQWLNPPQPIAVSQYRKQVEDFNKAFAKAESTPLTDTTEAVPSEGPSPKSNAPSAKFILDINTADSTAFEKLPGLGPVLSKRIVHFREALGGFVAVSQLKEVYGLPDSTYQKLKANFTVSKGTVRIINVNTADAKQLSKHPYLDYKTAKAICSYRDKKKTITDLNELKTVPGVSDSLFTKMATYLSIE